VPATFFVIGQQVHYYGKFLSSELVQQIVIGDHTLTHPYLARLTAAGQRGQIQGQVGAVEACGVPYPHLFRPLRCLQQDDSAPVETGRDADGALVG
jgi:peptidoglycan/xylan/chitin deacetylase (PgdA/CDA1 family)